MSPSRDHPFDRCVSPLAAVFRARAFQILIDGRFAVLSGKRGFHVHGLPRAFDAP
jgi:hypothetical protein